MARGTRVMRVVAAHVQTVEVEVGDRRFAARRTGGGWEIDGRVADERTAEALTDLVDTLARLRAVDAFRPRDAASYGLDRPRVTIAISTAHRTRRLLLGDANVAASALYARREGDPRVLQVGIGLLSDVERVFYMRDAGAGR